MARFLVPRRSMVIRRQSTLEATLPEGHLARFVWAVLSDMDFSELEARYASIHGGPGRSPYHPRLLAALWIYGMTQGIGTAIGIAMACGNRDDFRWLAGGLCPSDQTLLNLCKLGPDGLSPIWVPVLQSMHEAGHIDLSIVAEDGTKLRANASPRSFLVAAEIDVAIGNLTSRLGVKLQELAEAPPASEGRSKAKIRALTGQLRRAERAAAELCERAERRAGRTTSSATACGEATAPVQIGPPPVRAPSKFGRGSFRHEAERDVMVCPAGEDLAFLGAYPTDNGRGSYRLYRRRDCSGCPSKPQCTESKGRRLKVPVDAHEATDAPQAPAQAPGSHAAAPSGTAVADGVGVGPPVPLPRPDGSSPPTPVPPAPIAAIATHNDYETGGPRASLTEPEALMMLATSEKRWEPSYNADLAVTRHGVIVSQFLTKRPTDYHGFAPALRAVLANVGHPACWVGDGHYGTHANLVLADQEGVVLYSSTGSSNVDVQSAPSPEKQPVRALEDEPTIQRFGRDDFSKPADRDVLVCPAGQELNRIGEYPTDNRLGTYRLYGRPDCTGCDLKARCTDAKGRRVKIPQALAPGSPPVSVPNPEDDAAEAAKHEVAVLVQALQRRMDELGPRVMKFRRETIEPTNSHLKQHGLRRFYVHGLPRCAAVLTLACIAHNLMKWKAREATRALRLAA